jgi:hypothetical protein
MPNMTPQDAAMLKIFQKEYGTMVYPTPVRASTADSARKQNAAKLAKKKKTKKD